MRIKGLLVFFSFLASIGLFLIFFMDSMIHHQLQKQASNAYGAKIDIANCNLSFFPLTLTLDRIDVPDKNNTHLNIYSINSLKCSLSFYAILQKKLIIHSLELSGIQTNTKRKQKKKQIKKKTPETSINKEKQAKTITKKTNIKKSNKATAKQEAQNDSEKKDSFSFAKYIQSITTLPTISIDDLIQTNDLLIEQKAQHLEQELQADIKKTAEQLKDTTNLKKALAEIEKIVKNSTSQKDDLANLSSLYNNRKKIDAQYQKIKKDINFKQRLLAEKKLTYQTQIHNLKQSAQADYQRLENSLLIDNNQVSSSQALLKGPLISLLQKAIKQYKNKTKETSEKNKKTYGRFIHFPISNPQPRFWLKKANISQTDAALSINLKLRNLSSNNALIQRSATFVLTYQQTNKINLKLKGTAFISPDKKNLSLNSDFSEIPIHMSPFLPSTSSGKASLNIENELLNGNCYLMANNLKVDKNAVSNPLIAAILGRIKNPDLNITLLGSIDHPDIKISSDIDTLLKHAFKQELQSEQTKQKEQLQKKLDQRLSEKQKSLELLVSTFIADTTHSVNDQNNHINQEKNKAKKTLETKISKSKSIQNASKSLEKAFKNISF